MPLPVSRLLSLSETLQFIAHASGENENSVRAVLTGAAFAGEIVATGCLHLSMLPFRSRQSYESYFAHPALSDRTSVESSAWGGGPISWELNRVGRYDLVRFDRADIERWLASAESARQPESVAEAPASDTDAVPSGIRSNRAAAAEEAAGHWIEKLQERPASKDIAYEDAKTAVAKIVPLSPLSRKAFERQWASKARPEWKLAGRRRKSPT
jgi:hypothetical protein